MSLSKNWETAPGAGMKLQYPVKNPTCSQSERSRRYIGPAEAVDQTFLEV
jgi:hypothetical protein